MIKNYKETNSTKIDGDNYVVNFEISDVHKSLVNSFRRVCLSEIPVSAFDDTYHDNIDHNMIKIHKNISFLHNEFISHRLSLLPICGYKSDTLKIVVDTYEGKIIYRYKNNDIPKFSLKIKNDEETRKKLNINTQDNTINVTTEYLTVDKGNVKDYFIGDYVVGDYPLIHIIKPISTTEEVQHEEELEIDMIPSIGIGKQNARYSPVGTISYEFIKDSSEVIEANFNKYIENLQKQRVLDGLSEYTEDNINQYRNSYMLLDAEKIYKKDKNGEPSVLICVESVGNLMARQIVYDAISILEMKTYNIMNMFNWVDNKYEYLDTIDVKQLNNGIVKIIIRHEEHTMGNLISCYIQDIFINKKIFGEFLTFAAYKKNHPNDDQIELHILINKEMDISTLFSKFNYNLTIKDEDSAINFMFIAMSGYLYKLSQLKQSYSEVSKVISTSFEIVNDNLKKCSKFDRQKIFNSLL